MTSILFHCPECEADVLPEWDDTPVVDKQTAWRCPECGTSWCMDFYEVEEDDD